MPSHLMLSVSAQQRMKWTIAQSLFTSSFKPFSQSCDISIDRQEWKHKEFLLTMIGNDKLLFTNGRISKHYTSDDWLANPYKKDENGLHLKMNACLQWRQFLTLKHPHIINVPLHKNCLSTEWAITDSDRGNCYDTRLSYSEIKNKYLLLVVETKQFSSSWTIMRHFATMFTQWYCIHNHPF